jgi:hypothetical protein
VPLGHPSQQGRLPQIAGESKLQHCLAILAGKDSILRFTLLANRDGVPTTKESKLWRRLAIPANRDGGPTTGEKY